MNPKRIYLAGPYSGSDVMTVLTNIGKGVSHAALLIEMGHAPFCPWLDALYVIAGAVPTKEQLYAASMQWLTVSDAVLMLEGWSMSEGAKEEYRMAFKLGIPIFDDLDELLEWCDK